MIDALDLALIPASIGGLLLAMALVRRAGARFGLSLEMQRKLVHVTTGLYALTLPYTFSSPAAAMLLLALSLAALVALRRPRFVRFASSLHGVRRRSHGEIYLLFAVGFLYWFSPGDRALYVLPLLVLTLADAAAALAGTRYGSKHFSVAEGSKSWEGVAMFFMVTLILSMTTLLLMTEIDRPRIIALSLMVAGFGALVEAESWGGRDNLFVPVGVYLLLATHVETPLPQLALIGAIFLTMLIYAQHIGVALGMTRHAARATLVLIALMLAASAPHNALLAVTALAAHVAARAFAPRDDAFPDLDIVAVSAGVALLWLFAGEAGGANALDLYNLTFAGMAVLFAALAVQEAPRLRRLAVIATSLAVVWAVLSRAAALNAATQGWHGDLAPWAAASLALCAAAGWFAPEAFDRRRALRVASVAGAIPIILFLTKGLLR